MLSKVAWNLIVSSDFPMNIIRKIFLYPSGIPRECYFKSVVWSSIKPIYLSLRSEIQWFIGSHSRLNFWTNECVSPSVACQLGISSYDQRILLNKVPNHFRHNSWHLHHIHDDVVKHSIAEVLHLHEDRDFCAWKISTDGLHSVKRMYSHIRNSCPQLPWCRFIWKEFLPPFRSLTFWRAVFKYHPTDDNFK